LISAGLDWAGRHARWLLALGCFGALFVPWLSALVRPALPVLVMLVLGVAMARIDMAAVLRSGLRWRFLLAMVALTVALMPLTGALYVALGQVFGLERAWLVYLAAAPPIASAGGLCFIMGFDARRAVEASFYGALLTPVFGPLTVALFLPEAAVLTPIDLAGRLAGMIAGALLVGFGLRAWLGAGRIAREKLRFDGLSAVVMVLFVVPLFDGVTATILNEPTRALAAIITAFAFNMGVAALVIQGGKRFLPWPLAGTYGVIWGNRTIAMYLAALPPDPAFGLFVALYQFPMYLTPLVLGRRQA